MLTVKTLAKDLGLTLVTGAESAEQPIVWAHISELADPTPWLEGSELILTTGMSLATETDQRDFVRRLVDHNLAGLCFGLGFSHEVIPPAVIDEADSHRLPLIEIPYSMPFADVTRHVSEGLVGQNDEAVRRSIRIQQRLERVVIDDQGMSEIAAIASSVLHHPVAVLGETGAVLAGSGHLDIHDDGALTEILAKVVSGHPPTSAVTSPPQGNSPGAVAHPVGVSDGGIPMAWLVVFGDKRKTSPFEKLIHQQIISTIGIEIARQRSAIRVERRLGGDLITAVMGANLNGSEVAERLRPFGVSLPATVATFKIDGDGAEEAVRRELWRSGLNAVVSTYKLGEREELCAIFGQSESGSPSSLSLARQNLSLRFADVRVAASRPRAGTELRMGLREAILANRLTGPDGPAEGRVAVAEDIGSVAFLFAVSDAQAIEQFQRSLLGPLVENDRDEGTDLVQSVDAYLEENGHLEKAARRIFCHRHTLRNRLDRIEALTHRDLERAQDRVEFWLALRARELNFDETGVVV